MGNMHSEVLAALDISLEESVRMQLRNNHFPPVPSYMIPVAIDAIKACREHNENKEIDLPEGVSYQGSEVVKAYQIVSSFHLSAWLDSDEE